MSLSGYRKIIVLDMDLVVLRNLDHLSGAPTPSLVYRYTTCPRVEINSGLMVLAPNASRHDELMRRIDRPGDFQRRDASDQTVWRGFFPRAHCLPVGYNAFKAAQLRSPAEWERAFVMHDIWKNQGSGWWAGAAGRKVSGFVSRMGKETHQALRGLPTYMLRKLPDGRHHHGMPALKRRR